MKRKRSISLIFIAIAFLACMLPGAVYEYKHPAYNFDLLPYMALVLRMDGSHSIDELHHLTYQTAHEEIPGEDYKRLTETTTTRKKFEADAATFNSILPAYAVKPLYQWMVWLFYKTGFSLPMATVMPSILACLALGLFLFFWLKKYLKTFLAFLAGLFLMYSLFTVELARLSTPDALSAMFLLIATYFILERPNPGWLSVFLLFAIFTRLDNIIAAFFMISFFAISKNWKRISRLQYAGLLIVLLLAGLLILLLAKQPGWSFFFYGQFARNMAGSSSSYFQLMYERLVTMVVSYHFCFFMFLVLLILGFPAPSFRRWGFDQRFVFLLLSIIVFRFFLFPDLSDRFYFGFYLVIIMMLVRKISSLYAIPDHADSKHKL